MTDAKALYLASEALSQTRLKGQITCTEYDECMDVLKERLKAISAVRNAINS